VFRLSEEKRPLLFLDICESVKSAVPNMQVLIAGIGPMEAKLAAEIQQRGITDYVKLLGRRNDICELMRVSSLLLLTSVFEGTPNVVLEAQALGLPVVATTVGGIPDVVIDGKTGFLVNVDDPSAMVNACIRIMTDENLRIRMGEAARLRIANSFSVRAMVDDYLELLQQ
jgi:glycosyltransferase involved in cell wall biosynthesis